MVSRWALGYSGWPFALASAMLKLMHFRIRHITRYTYAKAVRLGPHVIRLHPRPDARLRVAEYVCAITPEPRVSSYCLDHAGNVILRAEFATPTQELVIDSRFTATTRAGACTTLSVPPGLPVQYCPHEADYLAVYSRADKPDPSLQALLDELCAASQARPLAFLDAANTYIYNNIQREIREQGAPQTPQQTLAQRRGACRDVAVLFIALCRTQGFAARFVSGYQAQAEAEHAQRYLHAWPEVYVPAVGWRGYDPTHGTLVDAAHVAVAAAHTPAGAAPVEGSYYGEAVESELTFTVNIDAR